MYVDAIEEIQRAVRMSENNMRVLATLGYAYAVAGQRARAQQVLDELQARSKQAYVSPYFFAIIYSGLDEKAAALDWLERAAQERHPYLILLDVEPVFRGSATSRVLESSCAGSSPAERDRPAMMTACTSPSGGLPSSLRGEDSPA